jgi:hypothetical protein
MSFAASGSCSRPAARSPRSAVRIIFDSNSAANFGRPFALSMDTFARTSLCPEATAKSLNSV